MIFKSKITGDFWLLLALAPADDYFVLVAMKKGESIIHRQSLLQLEISSDAAEAMVCKYLDYLKRQTSALCSNRFILRSVNSHYRRQMMIIIDSLSVLIPQKIASLPECVEIVIMDLKGNVIASSDASNTGKDLSQTDYFINGQKSAYVSDIFRNKETGGMTVRLRAACG